MYAERHVVTLTTDASGDVTGYSPVLTGRILGIRIVVPGSGGIENTADFTITADGTGEQILTVANVNGSTSFYPRVPTHKAADGAAELYAAGGTNVRDHITLVADRVKIVVAQGGNAKACSVHVIVG